MADILLGSHIGMCAPDYLLGSAKDAINLGCNTFMIYTGAPQNSKRVPIDKLKVKEYKEYLKTHNIDPINVIVHAPYIINIGTNDSYKSHIAKSVLLNEMARTKAIGSKYLVLHPGYATTCDRPTTIKNIAKAINELNKKVPNVTICLETMAGKGSEIGKDFNEIKQIIDLIENRNQIGVCFDTCHVNDSGLNVANIDEVLKQFDEIIGLNFLKVIHLNDSMNPIGAHKDRHENIGYGKIGFNTLHQYVINQKLLHIPKILETPWVGNTCIYKEEIQMLKSNKWYDIKKTI